MIDKIFFLQFLIGSVFFIMGLIMIKFPPKTINDLYGYRSSSAMKNIEKWNFAQKYSAIKSSKSGIFFIIFSFTGLFFEKTELIHILAGILALIVICATIFIPTEIELKKAFPDI